jgi:hypothetical protein
MNTLSTKKEIINKIKLYSSIQNSDVDLDLNDISLSSSNPIDFLFLLIKTTVGESKLENIVDSYLSNYLNNNLLTNLSNIIKKSVLDTIPENMTVPAIFLSSPLIIPIKSFDFLNSLKTTTENNFINFLITNVLTVPNTLVSFLGINISYNNNSNSLEFYFGETLNVKKFITSFFDAIGDIFDKKDVIDTLINFLFKNGIIDENFLKMNVLIDNFIEYDTENISEIDLGKMLSYETEFQSKGYTVNASCFIEEIAISEEQFNEIINTTNFINTFNKIVPSENNNNLKYDNYKKIIKALIKSILLNLLKFSPFILVLNLLKKLFNPIIDLVINFEEYLKNAINGLIGFFNIIFDEFICFLYSFVEKEIVKIITAVSIILLREAIEKRAKIYSSLIL